jgi:hypothetical protein
MLRIGIVDTLSFPMTATTVGSDEPRNKLRVELRHPTAQQEGVSRRYRSERHCPKHPSYPPQSSVFRPAKLDDSVRIHMKKEVKCPIQLMNP